MMVLMMVMIPDKQQKGNETGQKTTFPHLIVCQRRLVFPGGSHFFPVNIEGNSFLPCHASAL